MYLPNKKLLSTNREEEMRAAHNAKLQEEQRNKNKYMIHAFRVNDTPGAKNSPTLLKPINFKPPQGIKEDNVTIEINSNAFPQNKYLDIRNRSKVSGSFFIKEANKEQLFSNSSSSRKNSNAGNLKNTNKKSEKSSKQSKNFENNIKSDFYEWSNKNQEESECGSSVKISQTSSYKFFRKSDVNEANDENNDYDEDDHFEIEDEKRFSPVSNNNETPAFSPPYIYLIKETNCEKNEALSKVHVSGSKSPEMRLGSKDENEKIVAPNKETSSSYIES